MPPVMSLWNGHVQEAHCVSQCVGCGDMQHISIHTHTLGKEHYFFNPFMLRAPLAKYMASVSREGQKKKK